MHMDTFIWLLNLHLPLFGLYSSSYCLSVFLSAVPLLIHAHHFLSSAF
ncbi:hypothetical protein ID866_8397 [Astraeus odoratus]|nr:hypothetical protein ID866_8397 [Astraeus odoratus]